ncbi:MAG: carbohydrate ABC transporter permease [Acidimicrobiales bacterium]
MTVTTPKDQAAADAEAPSSPFPPKAPAVTIVGYIQAAAGFLLAVWGISWLLIGIGRSSAPILIGSVVSGVVGTAAVFAGVGVVQRKKWALNWSRIVAIILVSGVLVFGLLGSIARSDGLVSYLIVAVLFAVAALPLFVLRGPGVIREFNLLGAPSRGAAAATVWAIVGVWSIPTVGLLLSSFRAEQAVKTQGWWTIFTDPQLTFENYSTVLGAGGTDAPDLFTHFLNSLAIVIPATIIPIAFASFAAYAFAWMKFPGRKWLLIAVVSLMAIPLQLALIPLLQFYVGGAHITLGGTTYVIFPDPNLSGTTTAVWLTHVGFGLPLAIFLLYNYMRGLPGDILEAARIDGADHFTIFWRLVFPLSVPALAAFCIFQFLWTWNDYLVALTFVSPDNAPMTVRLATLSGGRGQDWHVLTAAAFVTILGPLAVFFGLQRYFVRGLLAGSVKG